MTWPPKQLRKPKANSERIEPRLYIEKFEIKAESLAELNGSKISIPDGKKFCKGMILPGTKLCCIYVFEHHFPDENQFAISL